MVSAVTVLDEQFGRLPELGEAAVKDLAQDRLNQRVSGTGNSIAWLVCHLSRIQDDHVAEVAGTKQVWTADGWAARFGLPFPDGDTGYGHSSEQVAAVRVDSPDLLVGYLHATVGRTRAFLAPLSDHDLDRVVDERWQPPVTLAVRLS